MTQPHMRKIEDIQILRAVAIASVLFYHLSISATMLSALPVHITNPFYAGVELFFVISGYVVTRSLRRGDYDAPAFLARRVFRLYPPIILFLVLTAFINAGIRATGYPPYAVDAFCLPMRPFVSQAGAILGGYLINSGGASYMNGAMWSLSVEFQFYALVAALALVLAMVRMNSKLKDKTILGSAIAILVVCVVTRILVNMNIHIGLGHFAFYLITFDFDFMALGVVLAYIPRSTLGALPARLTELLGLFFLCFPVVVLAFCRSPLVPASGNGDSLMGIGMPLAMVSFGALVFLASRGCLSKPMPLWLARGLIVIGDRSYTLYLLHFPCMLLGWVLLVFARPEWTISAWSYSFTQPVATAMFLVPLTELTYRYVELPWNRVGPMVAGWIERLYIGLNDRFKVTLPN
jgi:peptidoglycan/LPS O-acetylase OafA/YrhL